MTVICLATIAVGVLISKFILFLDFTQPMFRYGMAVLFSYAVFFLFIHIWLRIYFSQRKSRKGDSGLDALDVVDGIDHSIPTRVPNEVWRGGGGNFSGGGASSTWGPSSSNGSSSILKDIPDVGDIDEGIVIILILGVLAAVFGSAGYLIYSAPEILFEAAFEVVLATALLKRTKKLQSEGWKVSVFKSTWWLFAIVLGLAMTFGAVIKSRCPEASSFSQYREICWGKTKN